MSRETAGVAPTAGPSASVGRVRVHPDARTFLDHAGPFLQASPAEHNLVLSIAEEVADGARPGDADDPPFFASVLGDDRTVGAAFRTPPHKLGLTRMPLDAVDELARIVSERWSALPAVLGPAGPAEAFARAWRRLRGQEWRFGDAQRIYRLDEVDAPEGVPGGMRLAEEDDIGVVEAWAEAFAHELGQGYAVSPELLRRWIRDDTVGVWDDGGPVAMAVGRGFTSGGARIGYVYTPPGIRGRGYASALVAALSRRLLEDGREFCMLYARRDDPVTNRIYQRIGYRPVAGVQDVVFLGTEVDA